MNAKSILLAFLCMVFCSCNTTPASDYGASTGHRFAGVVRGKPGKKLILSAPDRPQHILGLVDTEGTYEATEAPEFLAGATVRTVEVWDFVAGTGSDRGFIVFTIGSDKLVGSYNGHVTPAEGGRAALSGEIKFESGSGVLERIRGTASYTGLADPRSFELRINGRYHK